MQIQSSLEKAKSWVKELQRQANSNIVIAFVGNKIDLVAESATPKSSTTASGESTTSDDDEEDEADDATATPEDAAADTAMASANKRQVSKEEAEAYAKETGLLFAETSAKTGEGVVEVFTEIGKLTPNVGSYLKIFLTQHYDHSQSYPHRSIARQFQSQPRRSSRSSLARCRSRRIKQSRPY